jgi:hypothetical protein
MRFRHLVRLAAPFLASVLIAQLAAAESHRVDIVTQMILRPNDPWPRSRGHVVLAVPGSTESFKAYHEPGGNFSPAFGSFGISLWVTDGEGRRITTSDTLPLEKIRQQWVWPSQPIWPKRQEIPAIQTRTPYYEATWSVLAENEFQLRLRSTSTNYVEVVLRGIGPAGGPLRSLIWFPDNRLFVNDRWVLAFNARPANVEIIPPAAHAPGQKSIGKVSWPAEQPQGYARLRLAPFLDHTVTIRDASIPPANPLKVSSLRLPGRIQLPDTNFLASLEAQVAQLMMGLVRNETRPGDPNHYPLNWLRDGAYTIVALARAGHVDLAAQLAQPFAEHDFFGGFGAEADAPGLALWAITEVAGMKQDARFDRYLWPHAQRKANLILRMLDATEPMRAPFAGPIVPAQTNRADLDLVCEPSRNGLIVGRMDWHRPILYVNAVSYRGLVNAADLARRLQRQPTAQEWENRAATLRQAWNEALRSPDAANDRTYISGLHPTWIVSDRDLYMEQLAQRRARSHDEQGMLKSHPLWTYFHLAEAHQWLALGAPELAWNDLRWFWNHQASPGLFTWWEGDGEENTFHRWESVMGWATPPHVTPHYWTAAEMLLLQLGMLTALDESGPTPVLRIGAGIPEDWLEHPLRVDGLMTRLGRVDWQWSDGRLTVRARGFQPEVQPGPAFPADIEVRIR